MSRPGWGEYRGDSRGVRQSNPKDAWEGVDGTEMEDREKKAARSRRARERAKILNPGLRKERMRRWYQTVTGKFSLYRDGARHRGISFCISFEEFAQFWQQPCFYCGAPISTIGIDRIDNRIGYESGNLLPCCEFCNRAKRDLSFDEFTEHLQRIAKIWK